MANKKRIATSVAAVATAAALLLGGTFAWQSVNQTALNEASDVINPGGRLHDDFNGTNKDVYVENFADEEIFARVRLEEYFEIVMNKGTPAETVEVIVGERVEQKDEEGNVVTDENGTVYDKNGAIFTDYTSDGEFGAANVKNDEGEITYSWWNWTTGGQTQYLPTFNLNKDSLQADINGTYDNVDADGNRYADYVDYLNDYVGDQLVEGDEIYDYDADDIDEGEDAVEGEDIKTVSEDEDGNPITHAITATANASLMSMDEWQALPEAEQIGDYWVYDDDGWVYYAKPIAPHTATGLLLDGIELNQVMDDSWYYAINVVGQFITADDMGKSDGTGFYDTDKGTEPTPEALELLKAIGVEVDEDTGADDTTPTYTETLPTIDFSNSIVPEVTVYRGVSYSFGTVTSGGWFPVSPYEAEITTENSTSYVADGPVIVIDANEPNNTLTLNATYRGDGSESYTSAVTLNVLTPATPADADALQDAFNNGGMININGTIETGAEDDAVIPNFDGSTTADYVWTEGGTVNGGKIESTSGASHTLFINNENNWPVDGDGANEATMNDTEINAYSRFAIYAQAVDAPITLNNMTITNTYGGGILAEYTQPITLNNLTVTAASQDDDYEWVNSAIDAGMGANVTINGGSYTGTNAVRILSSGANVTIYDGYFDGNLTVETGTLTIYGGTFTVDPGEYVAEGYEVVEEDGVYAVQPIGSGDDSGEESSLTMSIDMEEPTLEEWIYPFVTITSSTDPDFVYDHDEDLSYIDIKFYTDEERTEEADAETQIKYDSSDCSYIIHTEGTYYYTATYTNGDLTASCKGVVECVKPNVDFDLSVDYDSSVVSYDDDTNTYTMNKASTETSGVTTIKFTLTGKIDEEAVDVSVDGEESMDEALYVRDTSYDGGSATGFTYYNDTNGNKVCYLEQGGPAGYDDVLVGENLYNVTLYPTESSFSVSFTYYYDSIEYETVTVNFVVSITE